MKKYFGLALLTVAALAIVFTACAVKPQAAIDAAQASVAAVVKAGADKYAPAELKTIQDDLTAALDQVTNKKYKEAGEALVKIKADADALLAAIPAKIEAAKTSALGLQTTVQTTLTEVKTIFDKNKWKIKQADRKAVETEMTGLNGALPEVKKAVEAQDWIGAASKATTLKDSAVALLEKINKLLGKK
jgi:hypothetical protein